MSSSPLKKLVPPPVPTSNQSDQSGDSVVAIEHPADAGKVTDISEASLPRRPVSGASPLSQMRTGSSSRPNIKYLLHALLKHGASDLHIKANRPPMYRINGKIVPAKMAELNADSVKEILHSVLTSKQLAKLHENYQVDCSFALEGMGRFRANIFLQRGTYAGVIRMIPLVASSLDSLRLPSVLKELALKKRGLILVTGSTGSGKSTTMASMVNHINEHRHAHIVTLEDPVEFVHRDQKSSISQREVGTDVASIQDGLMGALRQDPDVIAVGEMRNFEAIATALTAAETGHLVLSTLHTNDVKSTIDRIVDVFPSGSKDQVRIQLSASLLAIISQRLVTTADGESRIPVCEILIKSPTIENLILKNELGKLDEAIASSATYYKMQTFNQALEKLVMAGVITNEDAIYSSNAPEELKMRLSGFKKEEGY